MNYIRTLNFTHKTMNILEPLKNQTIRSYYIQPHNVIILVSSALASQHTPDDNNLSNNWLVYIHPKTIASQ